MVSVGYRLSLFNVGGGRGGGEMNKTNGGIESGLLECFGLGFIVGDSP